MIIARIRGGLGNQMFQYATAKALAQTIGSEFRLHVPRLRLHADRPFELGVFRAELRLATVRDFNAFRGGPLAIPLLRKRRHPQALVEHGHNFVPDVLNARAPTYLDGYWQTEKYFVKLRASLLDDFSLAVPPGAQNEELLARVATCESVAVHVRRGDYVTNHVAHAHHGTTPLQYYGAGMGYMRGHLSAPRFFVFSDDPSWSREHLSGDDVTFVRHNQGAGHEDLRLMMACKHQIIANSSFSWWGAWLNRNADKIVIAPRTWLNLPEPDFADVYPDGWIRM